MKDFVEELQWRGMIQDRIPGVESHLKESSRIGYIGFDPTAKSLTVGNLVALMLLKHFQECGHKPIIVMGGATGMIGDPSGKAEERKLLSLEIIQENLHHQEKQFRKFLDFEEVNNKAEIVNNFDWYKGMGVLDFLRDIGKHLTINYMLAKDSVKSRLETGLSFTEFSYQLLQGYDFYFLNKKMDCTLQMGGSDQWGNITSGTELIRRMGGEEAFAITTPLLTKSDGTKFGKSESGNIWLDSELTTPFQFYQFWINVPDIEAGKYLRYFTTLTKTEIEDLELKHALAPHTRILQKTLGEYLTSIVHSNEDLETAQKASDLLFGNKSGKENLEFLKGLDPRDIKKIFKEVPTLYFPLLDFGSGYSILNLLTEDILFKEEKNEGIIFKSKTEAKKLIAGGGLSINFEKVVDENLSIRREDLIHHQFLMVQKGKKNFYLLIF